MQSGEFISIIRPSFLPSRLTSDQDGTSDAALASDAPPLKGHTCSLPCAAALHWNERWHWSKIIEKRRQNCRPAGALDSVFIYCRSLLLLPSLIFCLTTLNPARMRIDGGRSVTWPAADCTAADWEDVKIRENMALTVSTPQSLCVCVSVSRIDVQSVSLHTSKYTCTFPAIKKQIYYLYVNVGQCLYS